MCMGCSVVVDMAFFIILKTSNFDIKKTNTIKIYSAIKKYYKKRYKTRHIKIYIKRNDKFSRFKHISHWLERLMTAALYLKRKMASTHWDLWCSGSGGLRVSHN